jgi:hypothetical protein
MVITNVENLSRSGQPDDVLRKLGRVVSAYLRSAKRCKIGITRHPAMRAHNYSMAGLRYSRMSLIYVTTSHHHAQYVERHLIARYRRWIDNIREGGGGPTRGPGLRYVYLMTR